MGRCGTASPHGYPSRIRFLRLGSRMRGPAGTPIGKLRRITISNVNADQSSILEVALKASDGKPVLVLSKAPQRRVVIDCGFTRYWHGPTERTSYIFKTPGTVRLAQNIAAIDPPGEAPLPPPQPLMLTKKVRLRLWKWGFRGMRRVGSQWQSGDLDPMPHPTASAMVGRERVNRSGCRAFAYRLAPQRHTSCQGSPFQRS